MRCAYPPYTAFAMPYKLRDMMRVHRHAHAHTHIHTPHTYTHAHTITHTHTHTHVCGQVQMLLAHLHVIPAPHQLAMAHLQLTNPVHDSALPSQQQCTAAIRGGPLTSLSRWSMAGKSLLSRTRKLFHIMAGKGIFRPSSSFKFSCRGDHQQGAPQCSVGPHAGETTNREHLSAVWASTQGTYMYVRTHACVRAHVHTNIHTSERKSERNKGKFPRI